MLTDLRAPMWRRGHVMRLECSPQGIKNVTKEQIYVAPWTHLAVDHEFKGSYNTLDHSWTLQLI